MCIVNNERKVVYSINELPEETIDRMLKDIKTLFDDCEIRLLNYREIDGNIVLNTKKYDDFRGDI